MKDHPSSLGQKIDRIVAQYPQAALVRTVVREGLNLAFGTPFLGAMVDDAITGVIGRREADRVQEWLQDLDDAFQRLDASKLDTSFLGSEEQVELFISTAERVGRSHQREKHEALRNAFVNASCAGGSEGPFKHIAVRLVGDLTVEHMHVLRIVCQRDDGFTEAERAANEDRTTLDHLADALSLLSRTDTEAVAFDLLSLGLLRDWWVGRYDTPSVTDSFAPTASSRRFVAFISEPENDV